VSKMRFMVYRSLDQRITISGEMVRLLCDNIIEAVTSLGVNVLHSAA
jgi:hypothetical protein